MFVIIWDNSFGRPFQLKVSCKVKLWKKLFPLNPPPLSSSKQRRQPSLKAIGMYRARRQRIASCIVEVIWLCKLKWLCFARKRKKSRSGRKWLPKRWFQTEANACGHCGEASAKLTKLITGLDKLLALIVLIVWQGLTTRSLRIKFLCKQLESPQNDSSKELHSDAEEWDALIIVAGSSGPLVLL